MIILLIYVLYIIFESYYVFAFALDFLQVSIETVTKNMKLAQKFADNKIKHNFEMIVVKLCQND